MTVRTCFAPSPTGLLHIGGVRTASSAGSMPAGTTAPSLRIADRPRAFDAAAVQVIPDGMDWLGLHGRGPFYQLRATRVAR